MVELDAMNSTFRRYLRSLGDFEALSADLRRQLRFFGDHGAYKFLGWWESASRPTEDWAASRGRLSEPVA